MFGTLCNWSQAVTSVLIRLPQMLVLRLCPNMTLAISYLPYRKETLHHQELSIDGELETVDGTKNTSKPNCELIVVVYNALTPIFLLEANSNVL